MEIKYPTFKYFNEEWNNEPHTNDEYGDTHVDGVDEIFNYKKPNLAIED
jgi:hypothetical protein